MLINRRQAIIGSVGAAAGFGLYPAFGQVPPLKKKDRYKVGFAQTESNNPWRLAQTASMKDEAAKRDGQVVYTDAAGWAAKQVADVNSMIAQGVDFIFLPPREEKPLIPAVMNAKKAGIPVLLVDRNVDPSLAKPGVDFLAFIGSNFVQEGQRVADWTIKQTGGKGKIIELEGSVGASPANDRKKGFDDTIKAKAPDMVILASQSGDFARDKGRQVAELCCRRIPTRPSSMRITTRWRLARSRRSKPPARSPARISWSCRSTAKRMACRRSSTASSDARASATRASAPQPSTSCTNTPTARRSRR